MFQSDVLVNYTDSSFNMGINKESTRIAKAAGSGMVKELQRFSRLEPGEFKISLGYNLQCKEIYHGNCGDLSRIQTETGSVSIFYFSSYIHYG